MIQKEYQVEATQLAYVENQKPGNINKDEILKILDAALLQGAIVDLKILKAVDITNEGVRFTKIRMDIVSNTDFETYKL